MTLPIVVLAAAAALVTYTYMGYPLLLRGVAALRPGRTPAWSDNPDYEVEWPFITITVPAYNEEAQIRETLESLLALDYPPQRRQIVVVSDASTDRTDDIVREYAGRGVELVSMPQRMGKTAAENAARKHLRGEIVVNTDASIRITPEALKPLIARFRDPEVGLASGRDISIGTQVAESNVGESGYVGFEMWVRSLETRVQAIVGASGCFYAIRAPLHHGNVVPDGLCRDFAAALVTREHGYRAVSVDEAVCLVPRAPSLRGEYRRKVRTIARGLRTILHKRDLLNPLRHGLFAWMLLSHKLCRWLVPWALLAALGAIALLSLTEPWARLILVVALGGLALAGLGWVWPAGRPLPRFLALATYAVAGNWAVIQAWVRVGVGGVDAVWEPTRRHAGVAR
jgi:cellulose synthase/poly-beta-1,6-N-acetylglucosamine synthase-like glycosyltransferase